MLRDRATRRYGLLFFGLAVALTATLGFGFRRLGLVLSWVLAATVVTFVAYGTDKLLARANRLRVPERVLLALGFAGGTLGALVGRVVFHHKTTKASFRLKLWLVTAFQGALLAAYLLWIRPPR